MILPEPRMLAGKPDTGFIAQELSGAWPYAISPIGSRNLLANDLIGIRRKIEENNNKLSEG